MARKSDTDAQRAARELFIDELIAAYRSASEEASDRKDRERRAEDAFFRAAASLEAFESEWFVRCLSVDGTQFIHTYEARAANFARTELDRWDPAGRLWRDNGLSPTITVTIPLGRRHTLSECRALLGSEDDNYAVRSAADLHRDAKQLLVSVFAQRIAKLGPNHSAVFDATIAIRNAIAHRSTRAVTRMNDALRSPNLPTDLRIGTNNVRASGIGHYLSSNGGNGPRYTTYFATLGQFAHRLVPTRGRPRVIR